jgi:hypothetical protein
MYRLDFVNRLRHEFDFVKMDVYGYEMDCHRMCRRKALLL